MTAEHLRAHARTYRDDAARFRTEPGLVDGVGGLDANQWRLVYEQVARELDRIADTIQGQEAQPNALVQGR